VEFRVIGIKLSSAAEFGFEASLARAKKIKHPFNVRDLGFINYNGELEVHQSLLNVILHDAPQIRRGDNGK
jgi:hypothetical protein